MSKKKVFGFKTGKHIIDIEAPTEEKALAILYKKAASFIDKINGIEMLGERTPLTDFSPSTP